MTLPLISDPKPRPPSEPSGENAWFQTCEAGMVFCRMTEELATRPGTKMEKELRSLERALEIDLVGLLDQRPVNLVDLGTGDGTKMRLLVEALRGAGARTVRYLPVDANPFISRYAIFSLARGASRTWTPESSTINASLSLGYSGSKGT